MTAAQLAALHALCFQVPRPWSQTEFAELLEQPFTYLLTLPHAFLLARIIADEAELLTLAVHPNHRRAGHGAELVTRFLHQAADHGARSAFLEVAADNQAAIKLYQSSGFTQAGTRRAYYRRDNKPALDALVMVRQVTARAAEPRKDVAKSSKTG